MQTRTIGRLETLADAEFSVFSQWGEDGIIEWIVNQNGSMPETFVEFGSSDYRESNTRFLLCNRNWRGLVIDGNPKNIDILKNDNISWRYDLTSIASFITAGNINSLIQKNGPTGEIGILSVDIDGNDYWVLDAITCVNPQVIIVEYNTSFGNNCPLSVPYNPEFRRSSAHSSNLYFGASISAFNSLAIKKGYTLIGTNRSGVNAFFIRNDRFPRFADAIVDRNPRPSRFRESRAPSGALSFVRGVNRTAAIANMPVVNVETGLIKPLGEWDTFSEGWLTAVEGGASGSANAEST